LYFAKKTFKAVHPRSSPEGTMSAMCGWLGDGCRCQ